MEYFALSLFFMFPAALIVGVLIVVYLIYNRIREKKNETFEKRKY